MEAETRRAVGVSRENVTQEKSLTLATAAVRHGRPSAT